MHQKLNWDVMALPLRQPIELTAEQSAALRWDATPLQRQGWGRSLGLGEAGASMEVRAALAREQRHGGQIRQVLGNANRKRSRR